jgi:hypothetical protein
MNEASAIIAAILGGVIGIFGTYFGAIRLANFNSKRIAGMRLRETFGLELAILRNPKGNFLNVAPIIESLFINQQMAVDEFRFFLTPKKLIAFNKVWGEYYNQKKQGIELFMYREWKYISDPSERDKAIKLIEDIIAFTKPQKRCLFSKLFNKEKQKNITSHST